MRAIGLALDAPARSALRVTYPEALERDLEQVAQALPSDWAATSARARALSLWALTSIEADDELIGIDPELRAKSLSVRSLASTRDIDQEVIATRYALIDAEVPKLYARLDAHPAKRKASDKVRKLRRIPSR